MAQAGHSVLDHGPVVRALHNGREQEAHGIIVLEQDVRIRGSDAAVIDAKVSDTPSRQRPIDNLPDNGSCR